MIFKVRRLGPVDQAEIDLSKDLILLTGPNGTGKTYVAWAIYGFLRSLRGVDFAAAARDALIPVAERMLSSGEGEIDLTEFMREQGPALLSGVVQRYTEQLPADFAADKAIFGSTILELDTTRGGDWWTKPDIWHVFPLRYADPPSVSVMATTDPKRGGFQPGFTLAQLTQDERDSIKEHLLSLLVSFLPPTQSSPVILPAERIATTIFWRELSLKRTELVDELLAMEDQPEKVLKHVRSQAQPYPRPIRDSLQMAGSLANWSRVKSGFGDLADYLEKHLLRGTVRLSQHGQLLFSPGQRSDVELGVHITASVVKSLSLLVFYFRHIADRGDFLIIDEPELNLHPDNQRVIARVLARAANRGLKIVASTHSDYLIRELNNLIMLGEDNEQMVALRQKHGYEAAEMLRPEQLGVYLFRGNTAEAVPVDETGFAIETIDAEIDRLNAVSQEIYAARLDREP